MSDERHRDPELCGDTASFVLGATPEDEHAAFLEHLATCVVCREEVASLRVVVASLPSVVPQHAAPEGLKRRVMSTVVREAREQAHASANEPRPRPARRRTARLAFGRPVLAALTAAAMIAVLAVILIPGGGGSTHVVRAQVSAPRAVAFVRVSGGHAELSVSNMPPSPPNHVYELWIKRTGNPEPTDALFTVSRSGAASVGVPGGIEGVKEILVTAEPAGGSKVPTRDPIIVAPLG